MAEYHQQWCLQVDARVLQAARHLRRQNVSRDPYDEQFTKAGVENPLRRHARIAATQYRRERMLPSGKLGQGLAWRASSAEISRFGAMVYPLMTASPEQA